MDEFCSILVNVRSRPQEGGVHSTSVGGSRVFCGCFDLMETIRDCNRTKPRLRICQKWSVMYNELNFYSLKWFLSLYLKLSHYKIDVFTFFDTGCKCKGSHSYRSAPPGVAGRSSRRARLLRGAAQQKPFCNKPPVKQQVYYEMV